MSGLRPVPRHPFVGVTTADSSETTSILSSTTAASGFDFSAAPLFLPRLGPSPAGYATAALLRGGACTSRLVGFLSTCTAEPGFLRELSFADHAGLPVAVVPVADAAAPGVAFECGRVLARACAQRGSHAGLPLLCPRVAFDDGPCGWHAWNAVRTLCGRGAAALGVCVDVGPDAPPAAVQQRWLAEPVHVAVLHTSLFSLNEGGMPKLPAAHQELVARLTAHGVALLLEGPPAPGLGAALAARADALARGEAVGDADALAWMAALPLRAYAAYLRHVGARLQPALGAEEEALAPWADALQCPLQPLSDHLENAMYEVFERDAPKYEAYERAMRGALRALKGAGAGGAARPARVCVAGAGRGPLVRRLLAAAAAEDVALHAWAVEKNPNVVHHLRGAAAAERWGERGVAVVHADARTWAGPGPPFEQPGAECRFDLLVSELLGSFGDNELSPECVGDAEALLAPGALCIPSAYTSYLAPLSSAKLWAAAAARGGCESLHVVRAQRAALLAPPAAAFSFSHPGHAVGSSRRAVRLEFRPEAVGALPAVLHGFAGYFSAVLWDGAGAEAPVRLSTLPANHTPPDMLSWFPLFLPLAEPLSLAPGDAITLLLWRCVEENETLPAGGGLQEARRRGAPGRVWFEWALLEPRLSAIHNVGGRSAVMLL